MSQFTACYHSPLGHLIIESTAHHITKIDFIQHQTAAFSDAAPIQAAIDWLDRYFSGEIMESVSLPLAPSGTPFQQQVWERLRRIPYGKTVTYGEIAKEIAQVNEIPSMSAQAVGQAVGANPIAIVIPCHRVMGAQNRITGYNGGIHRKKWLLEHETKHGS